MGAIAAMGRETLRKRNHYFKESCVFGGTTELTRVPGLLLASTMCMHIMHNIHTMHTYY